MKNLIFVIWVLCYPLFSALSDYYRTKHMEMLNIKIARTALSYSISMSIDFAIYIGFAIYFFWGIK